MSEAKSSRSGGNDNWRANPGLSKTNDRAGQGHHQSGVVEVIFQEVGRYANRRGKDNPPAGALSPFALRT